MQNNGASKEGKQHPTAGPTVAEYVVRQEPTTIDLQAVVKKRQKLAEELQTVEKQVATHSMSGMLLDVQIVLLPETSADCMCIQTCCCA